MHKLKLCRFKIHESELRFKITLLKKAWKYSNFLELIHFLDSFNLKISEDLVIRLKLNYTQFLATEMSQNQIGCFNVNCMQSLINLKQFHKKIVNPIINHEYNILNWFKHCPSEEYSKLRKLARLCKTE